MRTLIIGALLLCSTSIFSQNLVVNGDFSGGGGSWSNGGCTLETGPVSVYGGSGSDAIAEIDQASCGQQTICLIPGLTYTLQFDASRRTAGGCTPATVGMNILVTGVTSGTNYVNASNNYSNTTFAFTTQSYTFTAGATDKQVVIRFSVFNNTTTCGVILDNVSFSPSSALTIAGPSTACTGQATNWSVNNITGGSGVVYSWSFAGATPASSALPAPTGVTWSTTGSKAVSVVLSNGTCNVITLNTTVNVSCVLPVYFISFTAVQQNNTTVLNWVTGAEINNKFFRVQRSANGNDFYDIGTVNAGGGQYNFTDTRPLPGLNFYRLIQVDNDGRSSASNIIKLSAGNLLSQNLSVYPNPAGDNLSFSYYAEKKMSAVIKVYDAAGRVLVQQTTAFPAGLTTKSLSISKIAQGVYLLEVTNTGALEKSIIQFVKK